MTPEPALGRSKRYAAFSDSDIIELSRHPLNDKDRYYLLQEISYRDLSHQVAQAEKTGRPTPPLWKRLFRGFSLLLSLVFVIRMFWGYFG